ncbi:hypothetical protein WJT74_01045 [Sphingomicrobium sp. XHP0239]|uniref:hypothetical protein n=1 Tax=Sphingomicrobium maritimum TaxID=3133972 RepID=UPI0031CC5051
MRPYLAPIAAIAAMLAIAPATAFPSIAPETPPAAERDRARPPQVNSFRDDQDRAFEQNRRGQRMSLRSVERQVVPRMRGYEYLGAESNGALYRLKFVREGRLVWIDVDPRSGRVVGTSGR